MTGTDGGQALVAMLGEYQELAGKACSGGEQGIDLAAGLQLIQAAQGGQDGLLGAAIAPVVFDELQIGAWSGLFGAEEHDELRFEPLAVLAISLAISKEKWKKCRMAWHYVFELVVENS